MTSEPLVGLKCPHCGKYIPGWIKRNITDRHWKERFHLEQQIHELRRRLQYE